MMPRADTLQPPWRAFLEFLQEELAPRPGRLAAVLRLTANCTLVIAIALLYQIPLPAYMAYAVFVASREEAASTLLTGVVAALGFTIAVMLSLLFYTLDASEPALRLPLMAASTFVAMFLVRTMVLGPVAFLAGFVLVVSQTLIDAIPSLEALTRLVLWLWVIVVVPVTVTILVDLLIGQDPAQLARQTALRLFRALATALRNGEPAPLPREQAEAVGLLELRRRAGMLNRRLRGQTEIDTTLIGTLAEFLTLYRVLPGGTPAEARLPLAQACEECAAAFEHRRAPVPIPYQPTDSVLRRLSPQARPVIVAMAEATRRLTDGIGQRLVPAGPPPKAPPKSLFVPDAFSNPGHVRFAIKTTIAVMACYIIYSGLDWPGIRTSVTTCFFVALGSLGETIQKATLRISGALAGGLAAGLCIVYVLPQMTDIGQLSLLMAAVSAAGGWVATSSDRLSYAGMQMAFAFFLGVLQGYGPTTDLAEMRDRVVGILLGNVVMSVVFSVLWPTSAVDRARSAVSNALRTLGRLLTGNERSKTGPRVAVVAALGEARRFVALADFELGMLPEQNWHGTTGGLSLEALERLAGLVFVVVGQTADGNENAHREDEAAAAWLAICANRLAAAETTLGIQVDWPGSTALSDEAPPLRRAAIEARLLLQSEIEHGFAVQP